WVAKNPALIEARRVTMQRELKVASDPHLLTSTDILAFIDKGTLPPFKVLRQLEQVVRDKNDPALELKLIQKKAEASHFSNSDLDRAWHLANQLNKHDYAWRLAT